jgi:hypothetical protein
MKRKARLANRKLLKRNVSGSDRAKSEGIWRVKDQKTGTFKRSR